MKHNMEEIDQLIKDTLSKEEAVFYDSLEEQGIFNMFFGLFKGKNAWIMIVMNIMIFVFLGLTVYCIIQFFKVETTPELIKYGLGIIVFIMSLSMLKIYAWMQMDKNALLREMKRLELQISSLSSKV